jgi:N utilization substance protein B
LREKEDSNHIRFTGRRRARVIVFEVLYRRELLNESLDELLADALARVGAVEDDVKNFSRTILESYEANHEKVDELLSETAEHWAWNRINMLDKAILRLAVAEMMGVPDVPFKVSISEAIEIAKIFSTDESGRFVNGILDAVAKKLHLKEAE